MISQTLVGVQIYPTSVTPFTKIKEWYEAGTYKPYAVISSPRVFILRTIPAQGIGAVGLVSEENAPIPYGKSYS